MRRSLTAWSVAVVLAAGGRPAAVEAGGASPDRRVAATANGQTVAAIDQSGRLITAFDASRPDARRVLVGPAAADAAEFAVLGYLTGDVVAVVSRAGEEWSLCTFRTAPDGPVDAGSPLQRIPIGKGSGGSDRVDLAVSHVRGWLAVTGLPRPLPPVLRAAVAGVRVGPLSDRGCPSLADDVIPVAAAVSPADELVLALRTSSPDEASPVGDDAIGFFDLAGRELLRLSAGVRGIKGLDFGRGTNTLWAAAFDPAGAAGLWRLDAACATGRQVIRPTLVEPLDAPCDLVASSPRAIVVVQDGSSGRMRVIDPTTLSDHTRPGTEP